MHDPTNGSVLNYKQACMRGFVQHGADNAFVVVFPTESARSKAGLLASNIRRTLREEGHGFGSVGRDGGVIAVAGANDPVLASSAVNQLFGISRVAIARRTRPDLDSVVREAGGLGANLLLGGERFLVRVEGDTSGFVPRDAEIAITSSIIGKKAGGGGAGGPAVPGSADRYDKMLYTYVTKRSAYVCIFLDRGRGGAPNLSRGQETVCPVYDEVSAVSCVEAMRQGYDARIIAVYKRRSELVRIAKMLDRIVRFAPRRESEIWFYRVDAGAGGRGRLHGAVTRLCVQVAGEHGMPKVSLPVTGVLTSQEFVDAACGWAYRSGVLPHLPMEGREDGIAEMAREFVLDRFFGGGRAGRGGVGRSPGLLDPADPVLAGVVSEAVKTRSAVLVRRGPNSLHEMLDSLGESLGI